MVKQMLAGSWNIFRLNRFRFVSGNELQSLTVLLEAGVLSGRQSPLVVKEIAISYKLWLPQA